MGARYELCWQYQKHYRDVAWGPLRVKSPATRLFVRQLVQLIIPKTCTFRIPGPFWWELREFTAMWIPLPRSSNAVVPVTMDRQPFQCKKNPWRFGDVTVISKIKISNRMIALAVTVKLVSDECHWTSLIEESTSVQVIAWCHPCRSICRHMASMS